VLDIPFLEVIEQKMGYFSYFLISKALVSMASVELNAVLISASN